MANVPLSPDDKMAAAELAFFSAALAAFRTSAANFSVVASIPRRAAAAAALSSLPLMTPTPTPPLLPVRTLVILDSSFNPPTRAHMQMATSAIRDLRDQHGGAAGAMRLLLLLSVNNADKAPKPAAFEQRLALMQAMAIDVHRDLETGSAVGEAAAAVTPIDTDADIDIDIGLTSEPFFHCKSNTIAASPFYAPPQASPEQVFLVGYDTLIRIFDPKYYPGEAPPLSSSPPPLPSPSALPEGLPADATPMQIALTPLMRRARLRVTTRPDDQWGDEAAQRAWLATVDERGGAAANWAARIQLLPGAFQGAAIVSSTTARAAVQAHDDARLRQQVGPSVAAWVESEGLYSVP